jgi:hypothetical protein
VCAAIVPTALQNCNPAAVHNRLCASAWYGFVNGIVGVAAVPSIVFRVILGAVLVWLIPARNGLQA